MIGLLAVVAPLASPTAVRMTTLGYSLALGIGASDSGHGFSFELYRRVAVLRPGSEITNLAIGGTTADDVRRLEVPRLARTEPQIVLLEAGANDAVQHRSAAAFARDFRALVASVRRSAPAARLVIFTVPDVSVSPIFEPGTKPQLHRLVVAYNESVFAQARRAHASIVDLYRFSEQARVDSGRYFSADQFHPSDDGHRKIADDAWPVLRNALARLR
jgi:lysophospholipase L1-like esterase